MRRALGALLAVLLAVGTLTGCRLVAEDFDGSERPPLPKAKVCPKPPHVNRGVRETRVGNGAKVVKGDSRTHADGCEQERWYLLVERADGSQLWLSVSHDDYNACGNGDDFPQCKG